MAQLVARGVWDAEPRRNRIKSKFIYFFEVTPGERKLWNNFRGRRFHHLPTLSGRGAVGSARRLGR